MGDGDGSGGTYAGYLMVGAGNAGASNKAGTGLWCYGPKAAPNGTWHFCGNNQYGTGFATDVNRIVINPAKTRAIVDLLRRPRSEAYL